MSWRDWFHSHQVVGTEFVPTGHGYAWWQEKCSCGHTRQSMTGPGLSTPWTPWMARLANRKRDIKSDTPDHPRSGRA